MDFLKITFVEVGYFLTWIDAISVVDPDLVPVGSETFSRIRIRKKLFRIRNEFWVRLLWKTDKIWQFLNKNTQFKNLILSVKKYFRKKLTIHFGTMSNEQWGSETGSRFQIRSRIRNQLKSIIRIRKKSFRIHNTGCNHDFSSIKFSSSLW